MSTSFLKSVTILLILSLFSCEGTGWEKEFKETEQAAKRLLELSGLPATGAAEIQVLIDQGVDVNKARHPDRATALHLASKSGSPHIVKVLLEAGANINASCVLNNTPLHMAVQNGQANIVALLVEAGADINTVNNDGETSLSLAAKNENVQIAGLFLDAYIEYASNNKDEPPLIFAASSGHTAMIHLLLKAGTNVNSVDQYGFSALQSAILQGEIGSVRALLDGNADINLVDPRGNTALQTAARGERHEIVEMLLNAKAKVNTVHKKTGITPLHSAVIGSKVNIVATLLRAKAKVNAKTEKGATPLHFTSSPEIATALLEAGAKVNTRDNLGRTPLYEAADRGSDQVVHVLLKAGAHVNLAATKDRMTPLFIAAERGYDKVVDLLIGCGAQVNSPDKWGATPLLIASFRGHGTIVAALLKAGANTKTEGRVYSSTVHTALSVAIEKGHDDVVALLKTHTKGKSSKAFSQSVATVKLKKLIKNLSVHDTDELNRLIKAGADINIRNKNNETALCVAAREGHILIVDTLIAANADVDTGCDVIYVNSPGLSDGANIETVLSALAQASIDLMDPTVIKNHTPLHYGAYNGDKRIVKALLQANADVNAKAYYKGKAFTPLDLAESKGDIGIIKLLKHPRVQHKNPRNKKSAVNDP